MIASFNQIITPTGYRFVPRNKLARTLCDRIESSSVTATTLASWARKYDVKLYKKIEVEAELPRTDA